MAEQPKTETFNLRKYGGRNLESQGVRDSYKDLAVGQKNCIVVFKV